MSTQNGILVIADGVRGRFVGQHVGRFIMGERNRWRGVTDAELAALDAGPYADPEAYDEAWDGVLDDAEWTPAPGRTYVLRTNEGGDVLALCFSLMDPAELADWLDPGDEEGRDHLARALAREASGWLETAERSDGGEFVRQRHGAPEWVATIIREGAHEGGQYLPGDARYRLAASFLAELATLEAGADEMDEFIHEWADRETPCYRFELASWLAETPGAWDAVEEAREEFGAELDSLDAELGRGYWHFASGIGRGLLQELRELAEQRIDGA